jgi:hypothetical protein
MITQKRKKTIFVIMPFSSTPTRTKDDLTEFFYTNLKERLETENFKFLYTVTRSDDAFDITAQIIRDVYNADIVLCDLSGHNPNPNVMYELGIRLSLTNKPVILFREKDRDNKLPFDIAGFYAFEYNPIQYRLLEDHIISKIKKYETQEEQYESPVLKILKSTPTVIVEIKRKRTKTLLNSLLYETVALQRGISGAISDFLDRRGIIHPFNTVDEIMSYFQNNYENLKNIPWQDFDFIPNIMPALSAYLVELPLNELIDEKLERQVNNFIHEYYNAYFAYQYPWRHPTYSFLHSFLEENYNFYQIVTGCISLASDIPSEEVNEVSKHMSEYLLKTIFSKNC